MVLQNVTTTLYIYNIFWTKYYKNINILFGSDFFVVTNLEKVTTLKILTKNTVFQNVTTTLYDKILQKYIYDQFSESGVQKPYIFMQF